MIFIILGLMDTVKSRFNADWGSLKEIGLIHFYTKRHQSNAYNL